MIKYLRNW